MFNMRPFDTFIQEATAIKQYEKVSLFIKEKIPAIDSADILRMQIVLIVSLMDKYFHDLSILYFENCLKKDVIPKKELFSLPMKDVLSCIYSDNRKEVLFNLFKREIMRFTFQQPNDISKISNFMEIDNVFVKIFGDSDAEKSKKQLDLIVIRRNQIVHEADFDKTTVSKRDISIRNVFDSINFIEQFITEYNRLVLFL